MIDTIMGNGGDYLIADFGPSGQGVSGSTEEVATPFHGDYLSGE
jgi:hypothetical protein